MNYNAWQKKEVLRIFTSIVPVYDLLNRILSLREDIRWRHYVARSLRLKITNPLVLDVATGTSDLALAAATRSEQPLIIGLDLIPAMLKSAQKKITKKKAKIILLAGDSLNLPFNNDSFDAVTIAFGIRNIHYRIEAMAEMQRVLKPGGRMYVLEFTTPQSFWIRIFYTRYLKYLLPQLGKLLSGNHSSYEYLAKTIMTFPTPTIFKQEIRKAGYLTPTFHKLTHGIAWLYVAEKPS